MKQEAKEEVTSHFPYACLNRGQKSDVSKPILGEPVFCTPDSRGSLEDLLVGLF